jgi:hypothetical protein
MIMSIAGTRPTYNTAFLKGADGFLAPDWIHCLPRHLFLYLPSSYRSVSLLPLSRVCRSRVMGLAHGEAECRADYMLNNIYRCASGHLIFGSSRRSSRTQEPSCRRGRSQHTRRQGWRGTRRDAKRRWCTLRSAWKGARSRAGCGGVVLQQGRRRTR